MRNLLLSTLPVFLLTVLFFIVSVSGISAATFTVTKTADTNDGTCDADCSLREAVVAANTNAGHDTIEFNIPESDPGYVPPTGEVHGYWSITTNSALILSDNSGVFIDGYSQTGATRNSRVFGESLNTIIVLRLYFNLSFSGALNLSGNFNHITGLNIVTNRKSDADLLISSNNNWIEGNFIGSDITGLQSDGGGSFRVTGTSNIFGTNGDGIQDSGERNLFFNTHSIGGGFAGLIKQDSLIEDNKSITIAGNYMGVDKTARTCNSNSLSGSVIWVVGTVNSRIGTNLDGISDFEESNIIACVNNNERTLLRITDSSNIVIQGNYIGTNPYGEKLSESYVRTGIAFRDGIGSVGAVVRRNTIANVNGGGISIEQTGLNTLYRGITIRDNRIFNNAYIGINFLPQGENRHEITINDVGDIDTGQNDLMNYPVITHANYLGDGRYAVGGTLDGNPAEAPFTIEVCKSSNHSSGHGGCIESLGTTETATGDWEVFVTVAGDNQENLSSFSALATNSNGSTSEFSANVAGVLVKRDQSVNEPPTIEFSPETGAVVTKQNVVSIAHAHTFPWEATLTIGKTPQTASFNLPGTPWWQASDMHEIWWKALSNDARILSSEVKQPFIVALRYDPTNLDPNLPERNLRLAYSSDEGKTWKLVSHSVLDLHNKTVATVTKEGGWYMLVSGYPKRWF